MDQTYLFVREIFTWVTGVTIATILMWEFLLPRRALQHPKIKRWIGSFGLYASNLVVGRIFAIAAPLSVAFLASEMTFGILNWFEPPAIVALVATILLFDFWQYYKHRLFHQIPWMWRLHRLHHADPDIDISTEFKHHPLERVVSGAMDVPFVLLFGLTPLALALRLLLLTVITLLAHANVRLSGVVEKPMRWVFVTPDMHHIHHSRYQPETDSNYGSVFSVWDRLCGTHIQEPTLGQDALIVGLDEYREEEDLLLHKMLIAPFVTPKQATAKELRQQLDN